MPFADLASIVLDNRRRVATVPVGDLKHPPNWLRQNTGTKEERIALARSYLDGPINLILISPDGEIRDGNRRAAAILENSGPSTPVLVYITDEEITPELSIEIQIESAEHTKSLTAYEQFVGFTEWIKLTGKTAKELAAKTHLHDSQISRIFSLGKCATVVQDAAKDGLIGVSDWHELSQSPLMVQPNLLADRLSGKIKGREEMKREARKARNAAKNGDTDNVKLEKLPVTLSDGFVIIKANKGEETLNLATARLCLVNALAKVDEAIRLGLSARTASLAWADTKDKVRKPRKPRKAKEIA
jgi:hypothetical protein